MLYWGLVLVLIILMVTFFKIERREKKFNPKRVSCWGDSLTEGYYNNGRSFHSYTLRLTEHLGCPVEEHGTSGERLDPMLTKLGWYLEKADNVTDLVFLGGTNNLSSNSSEEIVHEFKRLLTLEQKHPGIRFHVMTIPAMRAEKSAPWIKERRETVNKFIRGHFTHSIDFAAHSPELDKDGLHFTPDGYDQMGDFVYEKIS